MRAWLLRARLALSQSRRRQTPKRRRSATTIQTTRSWSTSACIENASQSRTNLWWASNVLTQHSKRLAGTTVLVLVELVTERKNERRRSEVVSRSWIVQLVDAMLSLRRIRAYGREVLTGSGLWYLFRFGRGAFDARQIQDERRHFERHLLARRKQRHRPRFHEQDSIAPRLDFHT
jgi:hypothetical protein